MFTGIVEELGSVIALTLAPDSGSARLRVRGPLVTSDVAHGDSIAVNGVCLTVVDSSADGEFEVDVMGETLQRTAIGGLHAGDQVNLERSVTPATRLGGHIVQGHVDGVGTVVSREPHPNWETFTFRVPGSVGRYLAGKGAVAVHGVSLTVVDVTDLTSGEVEFTIGIIPETQRATTLGAAAVGDAVNIEVDVMAKYVERLVTSPAGAGQ